MQMWRQLTFPSAPGPTICFLRDRLLHTGRFCSRDFMRNFRELEVCPDNMLPYILTGVIAFVVALVIGIPSGVLYRKKVAEKEIISAEEEAKRIINEAIKGAESKKREAMVEAKEKILA